MKGGSQLGCIRSGNKLQRKKKTPWSLGVRKAKKTCLGEGLGDGPCVLQRQGAALGQVGGGGGAGVLKREKEGVLGSLLQGPLRTGTSGGALWEDLSIISVSFPGVSFQGHGLF